MAIKGSSLRIGGLNSGLDTEAIVNAMTASTKLRITTNQRKVLKLQAQQEAYRSIIDKFNGFKDKYMNAVNGDTWLSSRSTFNKHSSTVFDSTGAEKTPRGITVSTNSNAIAGDYKVTVNNAATQTSVMSKSMDSINAGDIELSSISGTANEGKTFLINVTAGGSTKQIVFTGGSDVDTTLTNINESLKAAFGTTNNGDGIVFAEEGVDGTLKLNSTDRRSISTGPATELKSSVMLDVLSDWETGNNSITIMIDGDERTLSFQTLANEYFNGFEITADGIKAKTATVDDLTDEEKALSEEQQAAIIKDIQKEYDSRVSVLEDILTDMGYTEWLDGQSNHNPDFKKTTLTADERASAAQIDINDIEKGDMTDDEFEAAKLKAVTERIGKLEGDEKTTALANLDDELLKKIKGSMSTEQLNLFNAEVVRRNTATNQSNYDKALMDAYDVFDKLQREAIGRSVIDNPDYDPDLPAGEDNPRTITNPDYIFYEQWRDDIMKLSKDAPSLDTDWTAGIPDADAMKAAILSFVSGNADSKWGEKLNEEKTMLALEAAVSDTNKIVNAAKTKSENSQIDELMFIRGAYSEQAAYKNNYYQDYLATVAQDTPSATYFANHFNKSSIEQKLGSVVFDDGTKVNVDVTLDGDGVITGVSLTATDKDGVPVKLGAFVSESSANTFGLDVAKTTANTVSTSTRLSELGLEPDDDGNYNIEINGVGFSFGGTTTINQMMNTINANMAAGVSMTFSTITNTFELKTREYGTSSSVTIDGDEQNLFQKLGFGEYVGETESNGKNMSLNINDEDIETSSNFFEFNGTTITVDSTVEAGTTFDISVRRDTSAVFDVIKGFMDDYNELIDFVYGFVNEKPDKDYYFLTDADREELELTETQEKKWEDKAKQGLLYNDRDLIGIMSKMRMALFSGISNGDGTTFGLYSMGITTSSNYRDNGKLVFDGIDGETKLKAAIENNIDMVAELFTNSDNGLITQLDNIVKSAVSNTGARNEKGILVQKAGMANTSSVNDNSIYDQIKRINDIITTLQTRYDKQQDRYWKIFAALEKQMGQLNSQTDYMSQFMSNTQQK